MRYQLNITNVEIPKNYFGFIFITYFPDGMIYVGKHKGSVEEKYFGSGRYISKETGFWGEENLKRKVLRFVFNDNQLRMWERILVEKFDARNPEVGYNIAKGGGGYGIATEEHKRKVSEARIGFRFSEETKIKMSKSQKKRFENIEQREHLRQKQLGQKHSEESRKKISESQKGRISPMKGKKHSKETKSKISEANKGRNIGKVATIETIEKLRLSHLGKRFPNGYKKKQRLIKR